MAVYSLVRFARSLVAVLSIISRQSSESAVSTRGRTTTRKKLEENSTRKREKTAWFFACHVSIDRRPVVTARVAGKFAVPAVTATLPRQGYPSDALSTPLETMMILTRFPLWVSPVCFGTASFRPPKRHVQSESLCCKHVFFFNLHVLKSREHSEVFLEIALFPRQNHILLCFRFYYNYLCIGIRCLNELGNKYNAKKFFRIIAVFIFNLYVNLLRIFCDRFWELHLFEHLLE